MGVEMLCEFRVLFHPLPDHPTGKRGAEEADSQAEEGSDENIPEEMGRHHDAAQGDERRPQENADAIRPVAAPAVIESEAQPGADGETEGVAGMAGEEAEEAGPVHRPVQATLQQVRRIVRPQAVDAFLDVVGDLVREGNAEDAGQDDDESFLPAQAVDHHAHDDPIHGKPDADIGQEHPELVAPRAMEPVEPQGDILVDPDEPLHDATCSAPSRVLP